MKPFSRLTAWANARLGPGVGQAATQAKRENARLPVLKRQPCLGSIPRNVLGSADIRVGVGREFGTRRHECRRSQMQRMRAGPAATWHFPSQTSRCRGEALTKLLRKSARLQACQVTACGEAKRSPRDQAERSPALKGRNIMVMGNGAWKEPAWLAPPELLRSWLLTRGSARGARYTPGFNRARFQR